MPVSPSVRYVMARTDSSSCHPSTYVGGSVPGARAVVLRRCWLEAAADDDEDLPPPPPSSHDHQLPLPLVLLLESSVEAPAAGSESCLRFLLLVVGLFLGAMVSVCRSRAERRKSRWMSEGAKEAAWWWFRVRSR